MLYHAAALSRQVTGRRLSVLDRLAAGEKLIVITTVDALLQPNLPLEVFSSSIMEIAEGEEYSLADLTTKAIQLGYERTEAIEGPGQFSLRGSIFDIFPLTADKPYRIDFFDIFVDSIRSFDLMTQRSEDRIDSIRIPPARDLIINKNQLEEGRAAIEKSFRQLMHKMGNKENFDKLHLQNRMDSLLEQMDHGVMQDALMNFFPFFYGKPGSLLDYAGSEAIVILDEPVRIRQRSKQAADEFADYFQGLLMKGEVLPEQAGLLGSYDAILADINDYRGAALLSLPRSSLGFDPKRIYTIAARTIPAYHGKWELLAQDLLYWKERKYSIVLLSGKRTKASSLADGLLEHGLEAVIWSNSKGDIKPGQIAILPGSLSKGFEYLEGRFVLVSDQELFGTQKRKTRVKKKRKKLDPFTDLKAGSLVVHENHGIAGTWA